MWGALPLKNSEINPHIFLICNYDDHKIAYLSQNKHQRLYQFSIKNSFLFKVDFKHCCGRIKERNREAGERSLLVRCLLSQNIDSHCPACQTSLMES